MKLERYISPAYLESQKWLHERPKGYGGGGAKWAEAVAALADMHACASVLDYGCGQGTLGEALRARLSGAVIVDYDPAIPGKDSIEKHKTFDLVVCTDVLEHIESDRLGVVIDHLFKLSAKLVFVVIATRPSNKFFPDGRNVHLTIEPASWWRERVAHPSFEELEAPKSPLEQTTREYVVLMKRRPVDAQSAVS